MYYKPNATLAISPSLYSRPLYVNGVLKKLSFLRPDPKAHLPFNLSLTFSSDLFLYSPLSSSFQLIIYILLCFF